MNPLVHQESLRILSCRLLKESFRQSRIRRWIVTISFSIQVLSAERLHLQALENYMNNVHRKTMLLSDGFDKPFDIHYPAYVGLDDAKRNVIDHKLTVVEILVPLLKETRKIKVLANKIGYSLASVIDLIGRI